MDKIELKPCPFCGSERISDAGYIRDGATVFCRDCGARTHAFDPNSAEQATKKWNARALRAHDAGTDKGLRKARVEDAFDKIACANTVTICSLDEMESIVNRALDGEFDADLRVPPDSHAAESAAQLDAEDPAEPGEDVPSGYMKLGAVENAIRAAWARAWFGGVTPESFEQFLALIMARLAPKPSLAEEMEPQLELKLENVKPHASRTRDRILALLREKEWLAGYEITDQLCIRYGMVISDTNATARLREARRAEFGGHNIVSRPRAGSSAWEYACHD
jgi:Lar family restriction alleviation protein